MTKREFDKLTKEIDRQRLMSASQYRRERRHHVPAWVVDRLAAREPGKFGRGASYRLEGVGRHAEARRIMEVLRHEEELRRLDRLERSLRTHHARTR
jgi:hypothetical protein